MEHNHPYFQQLQEFWQTGAYDEKLLRQRIPAINFTVASKPETPLEIAKLLLELHPDCPEKRHEQYLSGEEGSNITIRLVLAQVTPHIEILEILSKDSRPSVTNSAKKRLMILQSDTIYGIGCRTVNR